jgi:hypothetical protein
MSEQFPAEGIANVLVVVEAAVQTFHLFGREKAQKVLLELRADEVSAALRKPGLVKLLDERRKTGRNDRVEYHLRAR